MASPSLANGKIADTPANSPTTPLPAVATIGAIDCAPAVTKPKVFPCLCPFFPFSSELKTILRNTFVSLPMCLHIFPTIIYLKVELPVAKTNSEVSLVRFNVDAL